MQLENHNFGGYNVSGGYNVWAIPIGIMSGQKGVQNTKPNMCALIGYRLEFSRIESCFEYNFVSNPINLLAHSRFFMNGSKS